MENLSLNFKEYFISHKLNDQYKQLVQQMCNDTEVQKFLKENKITPESASFKNGINKIYEFYQSSQNNNQAYLPKLNFYQGQIELNYYPSDITLKKQRDQKSAKLFHLLYLPKRLKMARLDDFDQLGRENAYLSALKFRNWLIANPHKFIQGPYFFGKFGVGKTYLLAAIAHDLTIHNIETLFVHIPTLVIELKNSIGDNSLASLINEIRISPVLMLDDLGAENLTAWVRDDIFNTILQYRMDARLPTLFSSNYSFDELEKHLSEVRDDYDRVKARRIMERIRFLSNETEISGKNYRENF